MTQRVCAPRILVWTISLVVAIATFASGQVLETETARPLAKGAVKLGGNLELQTSSEGRELDVPLIVEYGITERLELIVEPVASSQILPKVGPHAHSLGDTEVTGLYRVRLEKGGGPALAIAGEIKLPTAESRLVGTDKTDFAGILIASKRMGRVDTHANVSYTVIGEPTGAVLSNIIGGAFAAQVAVGRRFQLFSEVLASTGSTPGNEGESPPGAAVVPEAAGQELVGTVGAGLYIGPRLFLSLGVSYDNNRAILFRPGVTFSTK